MTDTQKRVRWAREYETIYILRPTVKADEAAKVAERIVEVVDRLGGKITQVDNWGSRKLAYKIAKFSRGIYVYVKYVGFSDMVAEIERNLRLLEPVIRFQTIQLRDDVDIDAIEVDAEETKFLPIEEVELEPEPDIATQLGLVERARPQAAEPAEEEAASDEEGEDAETEDEG
ncbi:MAG: 30S ribosomal protein S6 [Myxococcales bacterium]|nr:30S ribosomal protein S6 [Myxococcales bacterium]